EGAVPTGQAHEAFNLAALWKLPVIFICENNRYGMGTPVQRAVALYSDVAETARAYGIEADTVDGMDVLAVRTLMKTVVTKVRSAPRPYFVEALTYRFMGHSMADPSHGHYRTKAEEEDERQREALNQAMSEEMRRDDRIFLIGEEVGYYQGAFKVSKGFVEEFGTQRVLDTPITEAGFTGLAIGAAMAGLRPIVELMTFNFGILALDRIVNNAAKLRYMSCGQLAVPTVIRGPGSAVQPWRAR